jgi:hypothetical protein
VEESPASQGLDGIRLIEFSTGNPSIDTEADLLSTPGLARAQRAQITRHINRLHGNRHLQRVVGKSMQLLRPVQLQDAGGEEHHYEREDREWAQKGIQGYRLGPMQPVGVGYHFWNFPPGEAAIGGKPSAALMRTLIREVMKLYQPITGFRYPQKGEEAWPVRENPYAQPALGVVRIEGVTDNVGGYGKEKTDRGLRMDRAEAIKKLILDRIPPPYQAPKIEVAPGLAAMYISDKGGKDAFSRAQNRAVIIHIRPAVEHLTEEQEEEVVKKDVTKHYRQAWRPEWRELTRQRLRMSKLPGSFGPDEFRIKEIGDFVLDNFELLMFRKGQELRFGVRVPEPGKRPETQADVPDANKIDDLKMLATCGLDLQQAWIEYSKVKPGGTWIGVPITPSERRTAINYNKVQREQLIPFWRFFKGTKGAYATRQRALVKEKFDELVKKIKTLRVPKGEDIGPTKLP